MQSLHARPAVKPDPSYFLMDMRHSSPNTERLADGPAYVPSSGEQEFTSAFENAAIGMAVIAVDSRRLRVNRAFCRMLGYCEEEMLSRTVHQITHPDDIAED